MGAGEEEASQEDGNGWKRMKRNTMRQNGGGESAAKGRTRGVRHGD